MKLLELHLLAYGPFSDRRLDLSGGAEGLHVIYGPNEAGKSSALRALRAFLFGVPERTTDNFRHGYEELRVGGRLRDAQGVEFVCYRRKGRKATLLDGPRGNALDETRLQACLGGVDAQLFEHLFGIDHEALVAGGQALLAERGREAEALFGSGLGGHAVHAVLQGLEQEARSLFAPGASKPDINAGCSAYRELKERQAKCELSVRQWEDAQRSHAAAEHDLAELDALLQAVEHERSALERVRRTLSPLARRDELQRALAALAHLPTLGADFGARHQAAVRTRDAARTRQAEAARRGARLTEDIAALVPDARVLAAAPAIEAAQARLDAYRQARDAVPRLQAECEQHQRMVERHHASLGTSGGPLDVEALRVELAARPRVGALAARHEAHTDALARAHRTHVELQERHAALERACAARPQPVALDVLAAALDEVRRAGPLDAEIARLAAEVQGLEAACAQALGQLELWQADLTALCQAALPSMETLQHHAARQADLDDRVRRQRERLDEALATGRHEAMILAELAQAGELPREEELERARARRERGWQLLRRQWLEQSDVTAEAAEYAPGQALEAAYAAAVARADDLVDRLRREAQRVHARTNAETRRDIAAGDAAAVRAALEVLAAEQAAATRDWQAVWQPCGVEPRTPREMMAWREAAERIRERAATTVLRQRELAALERQREVYVARLSAALAVPPAVVPALLGPLLDQAEAEFRRGEEERQHAARLEAELIASSDALARAAHEQARAASALIEWEEAWASLLAELGQPPGRTPAEMEERYTALAALVEHVDAGAAGARELAAVRATLEAHDDAVRALVAELAPELAASATDVASLALTAHLNTAREHASRRATLEEQQRAAEADREEAAREAEAADAALATLCEEAACTTIEELAGVEKDCQTRTALARELAQVERDLLEDGDGLGLDALAAAAAAVDRDAVPAQLARLKQRIEDDLRPRQQAAFAARLEAQQLCASMRGAADAAALAEQAELVLGDLRAAARRYLEVRLAARVLRDVIERFRSRHRDPILTAASVQFARLSCGAFEAIGTDYDADDQPVLVGVRADGERLRVDAMSTGTRDQLYLALRLAAVAHYLDSAPPLPFIVDDILIQFDDERARATLAALADFSTRTQVILFTHHAHVVDLARGLDQAPERVFVHGL